VRVGAGKLRSTAFNSVRKGNGFELTGSGWGHGVGMCQYGTKAMAELGFDAIDILQYYYPAADIVRLYE
jgi:stage II sporulation protein D